MTIERFSEATHGKVIHLHRRDPQEALERLNRITGLHFARWPESLVPAPPEPAAESLAEQSGSTARAQGSARAWSTLCRLRLTLGGCPGGSSRPLG